MSVKKLATFYSSVIEDQQYKGAVGSPSPKTVENYDKYSTCLNLHCVPIK